MRNSLPAAIGAIVLGLACASPAQAKLYKWVDADGNVTYSERKPPDAQAEEIKLRGQGVTSEQARERLDALGGASEAEGEGREPDPPDTTALRERETRIKKNCEIARENLRILQTNSRIKDTGADGNQYFLSPEQIEARLAKAHTNVENYCD
jgi:hypothetical protein